MIKKLFFSLATLLTFSDTSLAGPRCSAELHPGARAGTDYCQLRVDGKDYKKISANKCVCPPDSELPSPKEEPFIVPTVEIVIPEENPPVKIQAIINGNKKKKITFNCKTKLVINVDEEEKPTGLVSCLLMDNEKIVSESRIDDDSQNQAYAQKLCQCRNKMDIPQSELAPYGMSLLDAVENPNNCKLISSALSADRLFQFCLIEIGGKQQVSYGTTLNDCKDACQNSKMACSLNVKEERSLAPKAAPKPLSPGAAK